LHKSHRAAKVDATARKGRGIASNSVYATRLKTGSNLFALPQTSLTVKFMAAQLTGSVPSFPVSSSPKQPLVVVVGTHSPQCLIMMKYNRYEASRRHGIVKPSNKQILSQEFQPTYCRSSLPNEVTNIMPLPFGRTQKRNDKPLVLCVADQGTAQILDFNQFIRHLPSS
jgi:hypothetical protein